MWVALLLLLDTGAPHSVLMKFGGLTSHSCSPIFMVGGQSYFPHQTPPLSCIYHSFWVVPMCPLPLLRRDLLAKLGASLSFAPPLEPKPKLTHSPSRLPPSHSNS